MRGWSSAGILCPRGPRHVKGRSRCGDCALVTKARSPSFSKNRCPRPRSMWQPRFLRNSFDNSSGARPGTTCTHSAPLTPAFSTGSVAGVLVTQTEGHGLLELDSLRAQAPSSCEHPFPFFREHSDQSGSVSILCQSLLSHLSPGVL